MRGVRLLYYILAVYFAYFIACGTSQVKILKSAMSNKKCLNETVLVIHYRITNKTAVQVCPNGTYCHPERLMCVQGIPMPSFTCPSPNGFYPDVRDCNRFLICVNDVPYKFQCQDGYSFDEKNKNCSSYSGNITNCESFDCQGKYGEIAAYGQNNRLYAVCMDGQPISLNECNSGYYFHEGKQKCEFSCAAIGTIVDFYNPRKYYTCELEGVKFKKTTQTCSPGMSYSAKEEECVDPRLASRRRT